MYHSCSAGFRVFFYIEKWHGSAAPQSEDAGQAGLDPTSLCHQDSARPLLID